MSPRFGHAVTNFLFVFHAGFRSGKARFCSTFRSQTARALEEHATFFRMPPSFRSGRPVISSRPPRPRRKSAGRDR